MADTEVVLTQDQKNEAIPVESNQAEPVIVAKDDPIVPEPEGIDPTEPAIEEPKAPLSDVEKKLREEAFAKRAAQRRTKELEAELAALKSGQTAPKPTAADVAAVEANAPAGGFRSQADFDRAVTQEAQRQAAAEASARQQADFDRACNDVFQKGIGDYKDDFQKAVGNLQGIGVMNRDILDVVLATDDPAKVLFDLGSDPDRAAALMDMTPAKRAIEIAKMAVPAKAAPQRISSAPAPVSTVDGSARISSEPNDEMSDAEWQAARSKQVRSRQGAGA